MISAKEKKKLEDLLSTKKKIILTTHTNPDGDAIGSSLAMYHYLVKKGHQVTTVVPNHFPEFLSWLPGVEHILIYEGNAKKVQKSLKAADLIFCLDYNSLKRVGNFTDVLERTTQPKILIDHHIDPEVESFDVCISTTQASSTGELVYEFIDLM
jgi:phosphoesterase RecJ-like protein